MTHADPARKIIVIRKSARMYARDIRKIISFNCSTWRAKFVRVYSSRTHMKRCINFNERTNFFLESKKNDGSYHLYRV